MATVSAFLPSLSLCVVDAPAFKRILTTSAVPDNEARCRGVCMIVWISKNQIQEKTYMLPNAYMALEVSWADGSVTVNQVLRHFRVAIVGSDV